MRAHSFGFKVCLCALATSALFLKTSAPGFTANRAETIPSSGSPSQSYSDFSCDEAGLVFAYPRGWAVKSHPDKDVLLKLVGSIDNAYGELSLNVKNDPALNSEKTLKLMQTIYFPQMPGFSTLGEKRIVFGKNREFEGLSEDHFLYRRYQNATALCIY